MNEKKVSVIIPIYNAEKYLNDLFICLDNNRFFEGDEVLLVDNNSSDASADMCLKRVEQNPELYRYIKYIDKADSYAARNQGVHKATYWCLLIVTANQRKNGLVQSGGI